MPNSPSTIDAKLSTERTPDTIKFFIACCQTDPTEEDTAFIIFYLNTSLTTHHTSRIISMSSRHGILPLIYKTLKKLHEDHPDTPSNLLNELKVQYLHIAQKNILMSAELLRIMKLFQENGIKALAFKGPTLSEMAYGDITLRQYGDLDILTKKEDLRKINALLRNEGYTHLFSLTAIQESMWIKHMHDIGFYQPKKGIHLEIHWSFLDEDYPIPLPLKRFWEEHQDIKLNGHTITTFSNENLLMYLCIHGSKHLWERIEWIKDIDLLIQNRKIDWETFIKITEKSGFEPMIYLGLSLTVLLFHTPLPEERKREIFKYQHSNSTSQFILESWESPKSTFQNTKGMLTLFPSTRTKILYLHKVIFKPSRNEYLFMDLPKGLYWVYYLVRPYLLLKKYLLKD